MSSQASVSRDVLPPTPPGPEGSNGNGLLRVQRAPGAWLFFRALPTAVAADFNNRVRLRLYELFVESGECPSRWEVAADLGCSVAMVAEAFRELAAAHMLVLQPGSGEVLMANPLSAVPTPFMVETESSNGPRTWYGNCIWDALGVIAMMDGDGRVLTSCGCCGESMTVSVRRGEAVCEPPGLVHFALPARQWWDDIVFN